MDIQSIFSIVNIVLIALVAIVVLLKARGGKKRGAYRQPIHLAGVLLAAITAFLVTTAACGAALSFFEGKEMADLIASVESLGIPLDAETKEMIGSFDADIIAYILAIPLAFMSPFVFLLVYFVASIIFGSARAAVTKFCKIPRRVDTQGKTIGFMLGALEGVLVMAFMLLPITALLRLGVPVVKGLDIPDEDLAEVIDGVEGIYESPAIRLVSFAGGEFLADELSSVKLDGSRVNLSNELSVGIELAYEIIGVFNAGEDATPAECETAINNVLALLDKSNFIPIVLSGAMNIAADAIDSFMPEMPADDPMAEIMPKLTDALKTFLRGTKKDTVVEDLGIFARLFILLDSSDVLNLIAENPEEALPALTAKGDDGKTLLSKMINTLGQSPRTAPIITALNEVSVAIMLQSMGVTGDTAEVYDELKTGIGNIISVKPDGKTEEEYKEELKGELQGTIDTTISSIIEKLPETPESQEQREQLEEIKNSINTDPELMDQVTDTVVDFLDQNPEILEMETIDDAVILDFVTSNFGDVLAGLPGFGGGEGGSQNGDAGNGNNPQGSPIPQN